MNLHEALQAEGERRRSEAAIGTHGRGRLWHLLDGDAHSYHLRLADPAHYRIKLNPWYDIRNNEVISVTINGKRNAFLLDARGFPEGDLVVLYVTSMVPSLTPFDWWWTKGADGRIEVCIRQAAVDSIGG